MNKAKIYLFSIAAIAGIGGAIASTLVTKGSVAFTTYYYLTATAPAPELDEIVTEQKPKAGEKLAEQKRKVAENWVAKHHPAADQDISHYEGIVGAYTCPSSSQVCTYYVDGGGVIRQNEQGTFTQ